MFITLKNISFEGAYLHEICILYDRPFFKDLKISAPNHCTQLQPAWFDHCLGHLITAKQCYTHYEVIPLLPF